MGNIKELAKIATENRNFKLLQLHRTLKLFVLEGVLGAGKKTTTQTHKHV